MTRPKSKSWVILLAAVAVVLVAIGPGGAFLYSGGAGGGDSCAWCHEIRPAHDMWTGSAHRNVECKQCHGGILTADLHFHTANLRRLFKHFRGDVPSQVLLVGAEDVERISTRCQQCHQRQHADWQAGPHSATYANIFLDEEHNTKRLLMDDCFRCHGMHFQGSIQELVEPVSTKGPWRLKRPELADQPVMPCITCHEVHRHGEPRQPYERQQTWSPQNDEAVMPPSLALFDRRSQMHVQAGGMPLPTLLDGERKVEVSSDPRQALCYQCHAPRPTGQVASGDDRTAVGVHEGIGCLACHSGHAMETRASCANCHPRFSNCGLGLEKLNILMRDPRSPFDIHTVTCSDCHPKGVPPRRASHPLAD